MKRCLAAALLFLSLLSTSAFSANYTGIWWNRAEAGWGINFAQQGETIFAAMYVYNPAGNATWYSATMKAGVATPTVFTGDLVATTGPYFANPFNPIAVAARKVGTMSFNGPAFNTGTLNYSVDGVAVTKTIDQFAFTPAPLQGTYAITFASSSANSCAIPGFQSSVPTRLVISGSAMQLQTSTGATVCSSAGGFFQAGATYGFIGDAPSCLPASRLTAVDLKAEGLAGISNANLFLTGAFIFIGSGQSCSSLFYISGIRIQ